VARRLVGREAEVNELERSLVPLVEGGTAVRVVLTAEAGMGKTSLLGQLLDSARSMGITVLSGRAPPVGGSTLTYGPVAIALAHHLDQLDPIDRDRVTAGLPSLGRLVEGLPGASEASGDPDTERMRLYQSVARLFGRLATSQPVVLVVDDLHWADTATVELLSFLAAEVASLPVGIVVAYRPGDIAQRAEVGLLTADLLRGPTGYRIDLGPLTADAVHELACIELEATPAPALGDSLLARSAGNPLAVEALARELKASGALASTPDGLVSTREELALPAYVLDLFHDRIGCLSPSSRQVMLALACGHRSAVMEGLVEVTGLEPDTVADAIAELQRAHLVMVGTDARGTVFEAAHPLIVEATRIGATSSQRGRMHAAWVQRLIAIGAGVEETATQIIAAGDVIDDPIAIEVLATAGRNALEQGASDAAARLLGTAASRARASGLPAGQLAAILVDLVDAWERRGEVAAAERAGAEAIELLAADDPGTASSTAARVAVLAWVRSDVTEAERLSQLSVELADRGTPDDAVRAAAERSYMVGRVAGYDRMAECAGDLDRAIARAGASVDARVARFSIDVVTALFEWTSLASALSRLPPDWELASPSLRNHAAGVAMEGRLLEGDWDGVHELLCSPAVPHVGVRGWRSTMAEHDLGWAVGDWDGALDGIVTDADMVFARQGRQAQLCVAYQMAHRGEIERAREAIASARGHAAPTDDPVITAIEVIISGIEGSGRSEDLDLGRLEGRQPSMWRAVTAAAHGEALVRSGQLDRVAELVSRLYELGSSGSRIVAIGRRIEGLAAAGTDPQGARMVLVEAAEAFERLTMPFEAARCRLEAAEVAPMDGDATWLLPDRDRLDAIGAGPWAARARVVCGSGGRTAGATMLTPRQREIALLVTDGLTNAEIAERLMVSIRTVTSHLDHAYTKLGISSRAALGAYVLRNPEVT